MLAQDLVANSWYVSELRSRRLDQPDNSDISLGLDLLNDILAEKSMTGAEISYYKNLPFNFVAGQEEYLIPDLISIDAFAFVSETVRFSMQYVSRAEYFGESRVNGIRTFSKKYYFERGLGGGTIFVYYLPASDYVATITGKFSLSQVTVLSADLDLELDRFYQSYLKYELAERIAFDMGKVLAPGKTMLLKRLRNQAESISGPTMTTKPEGILSASNTGDYIDAYSESQFAHGWRS